MLALREGRKLYTQAFQELARQVCTYRASSFTTISLCIAAKAADFVVVMRCLLQITTICKEHGQLMADIWLGNAAMIEMIIERLRDFSFECRTR